MSFSLKCLVEIIGSVTQLNCLQHEWKELVYAQLVAISSGWHRITLTVFRWKFKVAEISLQVCPCSPAGSEHGDLCRLFLMVHESCKEHGATPSQYMAFLHVYTSLYSRKKNQLTTRQQHLQVKCHLQYKPHCGFNQAKLLSHLSPLVDFRWGKWRVFLGAV